MLFSILCLTWRAILVNKQRQSAHLSNRMVICVAFWTPKRLLKEGREKGHTESRRRVRSGDSWRILLWLAKHRQPTVREKRSRSVTFRKGSQLHSQIQAAVLCQASALEQTCPPVNHQSPFHSVSSNYLWVRLNRLSVSFPFFTLRIGQLSVTVTKYLRESA